MILHLSAAGVPIGWAVTAVYNSSYGVALTAAGTWHERQNSPEALVEIENGQVKRSKLFWKPEYSAREYPDKLIHIQAHAYGLDEAMVDLAAEHMTSLLRDVGFFIPQDEWEKRYPASALISARWAEWHEADSSTWEPRWAMMMEPPADWTPEFTLTEDGLGVRPCEPSQADPTNGYRWDETEDARNAMRAMNSGWSFDQALVLLTEEPVIVEDLVADGTPRI